MHLQAPAFLLVPTQICICLQTQLSWGLLYFFFILMTAILFNFAPEELCSVCQSSKYKCSLNLSPKCSYCCQEGILEECVPDFHRLIWSLWFMFDSILLPLLPALLSQGSLCSLAHGVPNNKFLCPVGFYPLSPLCPLFFSDLDPLPCPSPPCWPGRARAGWPAGCCQLDVQWMKFLVSLHLLHLGYCFHWT